MKPMLLFTSLLLVVMGCSKKEENKLPEDVLTAQGEITNWGDPAVDGCGWLIRIGKSNYAMDNFNPQFKENGLTVKVHYKHTDFHYLCGRGQKPFSVIKIIKMEKL